MRDCDTGSDDDSDIARPRVPQEMTVTGGVESETGNSDPDLRSSAPLYANPDKLNGRISAHSLASVSLIGPIHAEAVVDVSPTSITLGATYEPTADDDYIANVCSLANTPVCAETIGCQKVNNRYVPQRLEFEKTFEFSMEVDSVRGLEEELQDIIAPSVSLTESRQATLTGVDEDAAAEEYMEHW